jgi:hypothetical protein
LGSASRCSTDFIKAERHRDDFVRTCPELVIVDEAHGFAFGGDRGRQLRHELLSKLAADERRHLILVTATPHSGKEDAFRSLLELLDPSFGDLPIDLSGAQNEGERRRLVGLPGTLRLKHGWVMRRSGGGVRL